VETLQKQSSHNDARNPTLNPTSKRTKFNCKNPAVDPTLFDNMRQPKTYSLAENHGENTKHQ